MSLAKFLLGLLFHFGKLGICKILLMSSNPGEVYLGLIENKGLLLEIGQGHVDERKPFFVGRSLDHDGLQQEGDRSAQGLVDQLDGGGQAQEGARLAGGLPLREEHQGRHVPGLISSLRIASPPSNTTFVPSSSSFFRLNLEQVVT